MRKDEQIKEVLQQLKDEVGLAFAYDHFDDDPEMIPVPYAIYRRTAGSNFGADGKVYYRGRGVEIELYAATPDEMADLMEKAEQIMDDKDIFYALATDTLYIEQEKIYGTLYDI